MIINNADAPTDTPYTKRYDYDGSSNLIYEGWAQSSRNGAVDEAIWAIKQYTYTGAALTSTQWAHGDSRENNIWANRASLSYK